MGGHANGHGGGGGAGHLPAIKGYGTAVASVAVALGAALLLERSGVPRMELPIFLFEIAVVVWYLGVGPAVLAVVASSLVFNYFFTEPRYSFYVYTIDLAHYVVFVLFAVLLIWFSAIRRRFERQLLQSRDELEKEVAVRKQQASLLDLTHDTIFVRDMNDVITYWNRGAQELFGWTAEEAVGKRSPSSCTRNFPSPSRTFARSWCAPAAGKASWRGPRRTDRGWWWPAAGPCAGTAWGGRWRSWKRTTT